jgi:hypothetical protein
MKKISTIHRILVRKPLEKRLRRSVGNMRMELGYTGEVDWR